ncbi:hypothetical protein DTL35_26895 [Escherichia coli]|nr:hypothetical protein DTL35_26895 [Escherichia coli]RDA24256.1 hypothetical protein DTL37_26475 [Escherichia coli]
MLTAERDFMQQRLYFTGIIYQLICCAMILLLPKGTSFYGVFPILHRIGHVRMFAPLTNRSLSFITLACVTVIMLP